MSLYPQIRPLSLDFKYLSEEQRAKVAEAHTTVDILMIAQEEGYDLTDERKAALENLQHADEPTFKHSVKHSALNRIKYRQWRRNIEKR